MGDLPRPFMTGHMMIFPRLLLGTVALGALAAGAFAESKPAPGPAGITLEKDIKPVLQQYCFDCHNPEKQKGDLNLIEFADNPRLHENREIWEKVVESVEQGDMPPEKKPQPSGLQKELIVRFVDGQLSKFDCKTDHNPGRVTLRRLNKEEYRNTVRELLRVDYQPEDFPNDDVGYGFDNIGDVLSLSPMLMEKFMGAAEEIAAKAIVSGSPGSEAARKLKGSEFETQDSGIERLDNGTLSLARTGGATRGMEFPVKGEYAVRVHAYGDLAGPDLPKLAVSLDGKELQVFDVPNSGPAKAFDVRVPVEAGWHKLTIAFLNNYNDTTNPDPKLRGDRNLYVPLVEVTPPAGTSSLPESHRRLISKMPAAGGEAVTARELLRPFLKRAYRRPVTDAEVEKIAGFVDLAMREKGTFLEGMQVAVQATLCSPQFLFRWELDSPEQAVATGGVRDLSDHEVAARLAYFLWSSMPDDDLTALADRGELRKDGNLEKQTARMLKDWRARSLVTSFAGQWLQIRNIWEISPDPQTFPRWSDDLKGMMKEETERFFEAVMKEDRSILDLLDGDFTFLNEKLARFYGIEGVKGTEFQRVQLAPDSPRGGVITQGAVLLATSTPTRTSPVIRGKWILEQILGTPPPPPPPDVPPLTEQSSVSQTTSLRQRLEQHMSKAECSSCHKRMDPLGFALENFDATGAWRDTDGKFPVDASGKMPGNKAFTGAREMKAILKRGKEFPSNFAEQMMTYALGRGLDYYDKCAIDAVVLRMSKEGNRFSSLVAGIITSDPFLKRKAVTEGVASR